MKYSSYFFRFIFILFVAVNNNRYIMWFKH